MATLLSNDSPSTLKKVLGASILCSTQEYEASNVTAKAIFDIVTKVLEVGPITENITPMALIPLTPGERVVTLRSDEVITTVDNLKEDKARNQRFSTEMGAIAGPKV